MGKSSPETPDYAGAARETAEGSERVTNQQTWANRPDQTNPWGSTTWDAKQERDPATGEMVNKWTQNQTLNPESQAALDSQMAVTTARSQMGEGMIGRTAEELRQPMDWDQFGDQQRAATSEGIDMNNLPEGVSSVEAKKYDMGHDEYRQQAEDANYARSANRLDTRFGQSDEAMEVKLASQGLAPGDQAYDAAMKNYNDQKNDAYSSAQNDAILFGGQEASRNFGMDLQSGSQEYAEALGAGSFANNARDQSLNEQIRIKDRAYSNAQDEANNANALRTNAINEEQARRQSSLNEMNAVLLGQQINPAQMESVNMASRAAGVDYSGAMRDSYAADLNSANAYNMGIQGMMSGGIDIAGMFSDRRLKTNIERIGTWLTYPLYKFQYIWGEWSVGIMSDEINQDAVSVHPSGFDIVDYGKVR